MNTNELLKAFLPYAKGPTTRLVTTPAILERLRTEAVTLTVLEILEMVGVMVEVPVAI